MLSYNLRCFSLFESGFSCVGFNFTIRLFCSSPFARNTLQHSQCNKIDIWNTPLQCCSVVLKVVAKATVFCCCQRGFWLIALLPLIIGISMTFTTTSDRFKDIRATWYHICYLGTLILLLDLLWFWSKTVTKCYLGLYFQWGYPMQSVWSDKLWCGQILVSCHVQCGDPTRRVLWQWQHWKQLLQQMRIWRMVHTVHTQQAMQAM